MGGSLSGPCLELLYSGIATGETIPIIHVPETVFPQSSMFSSLAVD